MAVWRWRVRGYYADNVKPPKRPGDLALEVGLAGDSAKDLEVKIFEGREDIGRVMVLGPFDSKGNLDARV